MAGYAGLTNGSVWYDERASGEPLVVLHGGAVDARFFEHNIDGLAEHFRVITTDMWGHGRTADREEPYSLVSFSTDVAELIERLVGGPAHLLGHSIGAAVALDLTCAGPSSSGS
jgi:pimeloyl-ACP methyl ester carboxylesterase